jgi:hypothetical protein
MKRTSFINAIVFFVLSSLQCAEAETEKVGSLRFLVAACKSMTDMAEGKIMSADERSQVAYCSGYLSGLWDSLEGNAKSGISICAPTGDITRLQMALVFLKWIDNNPQNLHWHPFDAASTALSVGFPCGR